MVKVIPVSIVITSIVLPIVLSNKKSPKKALKQLQIFFAVAVFIWAILCVYVYPKYVFPE